MSEINPSDLARIIQAILKAQNHLQWKPKKVYPHLMKRIRLGHLAEDATIEAYEAIIRQVLNSPTANVYVYRYESCIYPTLTLMISEKLWLVMIGIDGILETAFPPEKPSNYLSNQAFIYLGTIEDLLT